MSQQVAYVIYVAVSNSLLTQQYVENVLRKIDIKMIRKAIR